MDKRIMTYKVTAIPGLGIVLLGSVNVESDDPVTQGESEDLPNFDYKARVYYLSTLPNQYYILDGAAGLLEFIDGSGNVNK